MQFDGRNLFTNDTGPIFNSETKSSILETCRAERTVVWHNDKEIFPPKQTLQTCFCSPSFVPLACSTDATYSLIRLVQVSLEVVNSHCGNCRKWVRSSLSRKWAHQRSKLQQLITIFLPKRAAQQRRMKCNLTDSHRGCNVSILISHHTNPVSSSAWAQTCCCLSWNICICFPSSAVMLDVFHVLPN